MAIIGPDRWHNAIARCESHAPFLAGLLARESDLAALLRAGDGDAALGAALRAGDASDDVGVALRRERRALALVLAVGDLAGAFDLNTVITTLSDFADRALDKAIGAALRHRTRQDDAHGMTGLALGKHGAHELNYSSDIDPILLYDPATISRRERDEPGEAAQIAARHLVQTLAAQTSEGYVFRVDLRLRPASEVSPLAISFDAALTHYESSALAWERAAFIRARAAAGDIAKGEAFLTAIRPFVWRKSLDFGALDEVGRLVRRIRDDHSGPQQPGPGFDLKRGRGGIREIEFYAQAHQLIHGGRNDSLRLGGTRAALDALAVAGIIGDDDAHEMGEAYDRLRTIEHRLQMVNDRQTHSLPRDPANIDGVAKLDGLPDGATLIAELTAITETVGTRFDALLEAHGARPAGATPEIAARPSPARLDTLGFANPEALAQRIESWQEGRVRALRSEAGRAAFAAIRPELLAALAAAPEPERALVRFEQVLASLPSALNIFKLLEARPALLDTLAKVLSLAPPLADALGRRGDLLDPLIDRTAYDLPGDVAALVTRFSGGDRQDYEAKLDRLRREVGDLRFALGVQLLDAVHDPLDIGAALARVADAAIIAATRAATQDYAGDHGMVPGSDLIVVGLGRLGGGVLTHASDLDLVYLFSGDHEAVSDGPRPVGATQYFNRLAQRVSGALSVPTAEGRLFDVDTRLRPSGMQGLLAVSLDSFARYQSEAAWSWEHMALIRARVIAGPEAAHAAVESIVRDVLCAPRDADKLRADVLKMRADMARHKPASGPLDVKLARGGLVDIEFLVHFLQLRDRDAIVPDIDAALAMLCATGKVPETVRAAHALMNRLLIVSRLVAPGSEDPSAPARAVLARGCNETDWQSLLAALDSARAQVAEAWESIFEQRPE